MLAIQAVEIVEEFLLFELGTTYMVLGYSWLATLGETKINWGLHSLGFKIHNQWVILVGDPTLVRAQISLNSLENVWKEKNTVYLLELSELFENGIDREKKEKVDSRINRTLEDYKEVFQMPKGLPPTRTREHAITLMSGTAPINIRPYRYSFAQKNEIEKLVKEMLEAEIIKPSVS